MTELLSSLQHGPQIRSDISSRLRQETASEHQRIETLMRGFLFSDNFDVEAYYAMLVLKRDYYEMVESSFTRFAPLRSLIKERSKIAWLDADIHAIGRLISRPAQQPYPAFAESIVLPETEAQSYGFFYVFEGATLGGAHITSALARHECFQAGEGLQFFASYGRHTPAKWREFQHHLTAYCAANPNSATDVVRGARQSFNNMYRLMQRVNHG